MVELESAFILRAYGLRHALNLDCESGVAERSGRQTMLYRVAPYPQFAARGARARASFGVLAVGSEPAFRSHISWCSSQRAGWALVR